MNDSIAIGNLSDSCRFCFWSSWNSWNEKHVSFGKCAKSAPSKHTPSESSARAMHLQNDLMVYGTKFNFSTLLSYVNSNDIRIVMLIKWHWNLFPLWNEYAWMFDKSINFIGKMNYHFWEEKNSNQTGNGS